MKKLFSFFVFFTCIVATRAQPLGIGTPTPDNKAILDIVSVNKGVLIPRMEDTANVVNPAEGLIIFNKSSRKPYFYDGSKWVAMGNLPLSSATPTDRITYALIGNLFDSRELPVNTLTQEVTVSFDNGFPSKASPSDFSFTKPADRHSPAFSRMAAVPTLLSSIEFKVYAAGAVSPYISYRLKNIVVKAFSSNGASVGEPYTENISFSFENYGFKDWVNNISFGFNIKLFQLSVY
ncbi:MAG: type VI secretion system tube protein Hcp [Bacteroidota bacterium]